MKLKWMRQLRVVAALLITATMVGGCGKLPQVVQKQSDGAKAQLAVVIPIPWSGGLHAESFMDDITLTTAVVKLQQGATTRVQSVGIFGNTAQVYFDDLLSGTWQITATLRDEDNYDIFTGSKATSLTATETTVELELTAVPGTLDVEVTKPTTINIVSGEATLVATQGQGITRSLLVGATTFTASFTNVVPAIKPLRVKLLGSDSSIIDSGEQPVNVLPGRTTTALVTVTTNGSVIISAK